jgi:hypothetical protein
MKKQTLLILASTPLLLFAKPVKVDEIITEQNKIKAGISISYANINKKANVIVPISYHTEHGDHVNIPTYLGNSSINQDYINYGIQFKYGITKDLELFTNTNFYTNNIRTTDTTFNNENNQGFNNVNVGLTYQVKQEDDSPSLLIGSSVDLLERVTFSDDKKDDFSFKSYSLFATSYYTVDPIVFLLNASARFSLAKEFENQSIQNGNTLSFSPSVVFAVNPYTSLSWGISYQYKTKDKINNQVVSNNQSLVSYRFGVSYELNSKNILNFSTGKKDTNEYSSNNINLSLSYKF